MRISIPRSITVNIGAMSEPVAYTIKEISVILDEEQHVLRYWEREFDFLNPKKNEAGNRIYDEYDLAVLKELKKLIRHERKTIQEARSAFIAQYPNGSIDDSKDEKQYSTSRDELESLQKELKQIIKKLRT